MKVAASFLLVIFLVASAAAAEPTGTVTIYRTHDLKWHVGETVLVDGARLGYFDANTTLTVALPAGKHTIGAYGDRIVIDVVPGVAYFVRVASCYECRAPGSNIHQVSTSEAQPALAKSRSVTQRNIEAMNLVIDPAAAAK